MDRGGHRSGAEDNPQLLAESVGVGVAGVDAGEVRDGGESAFCHSGNQMDGGRHLRVAEVEPRLLVVVVGLGVAGVDGGELGCGGRSSGAVGIGVAGCLGRRWCVLRAPVRCGAR